MGSNAQAGGEGAHAETFHSVCVDDREGHPAQVLREASAGAGRLVVGSRGHGGSTEAPYRWAQPGRRRASPDRQPTSSW